MPIVRQMELISELTKVYKNIVYINMHLTVDKVEPFNINDYNSLIPWYYR